MFKSYLKSSLILLNQAINYRSSNLDFFAIRGFPKSGTNWLGNLMALHPEVCITGEWGFLKLAEGRDHILQTGTWTASHAPHMTGALDIAFERMIKDLMTRNAASKNPFARIKCICDKTPAKAYPPTIKNSKCLFIVRDVRDVIVSRAYHLLRVEGDWGLKSSAKMMQNLKNYGDNLQYFKEHPEELLQDLDWVRDNAKLWVLAVEQVLDAESLGLSQLYPNYNIEIIRYEDLHRDVEAERRRCYTFLGLDPKKARPLDSGPIKTSPGFATERPQEFYRKGTIGDWKNYFHEATIQVVMEEAGSVLERLNYLV